MNIEACLSSGPIGVQKKVRFIHLCFAIIHFYVLDKVLSVLVRQVVANNDGNDAVTRDLCIFGIPEKEKEIFDKFISEVKNARSFLDIGAGIGLYTLFTLGRNSHISVLSIEPNPKVFKTLNRNLENFQSGSQIVRTLNKVVTSKDKKKKIDINMPSFFPI